MLNWTWDENPAGRFPNSASSVSQELHKSIPTVIVLTFLFVPGKPI